MPQKCIEFDKWVNIPRPAHLRDLGQESDDHLICRWVERDGRGMVMRKMVRAWVVGTGVVVRVWWYMRGGT